MIKARSLKLGGSGLFIFLGVVLAAAAAVLSFAFLNSASENGGTTSNVAAEPVVVAAQDIPAGATITAEMVTMKDIAISSVIPDVFRDTESVVGQVTTVRVIAGEQVLPTKVSTTAIDTSNIEGELPISLVIPQGMRGFSIAVSEAGAAGGLVQPGDYVDLLATAETVESDNQLGISSCYVLQDVRVIALAQNVINTPASADQSNIKPASGAENPGAATATMAVTPAQAATLAAAQRSLNGSNVEQHLWVSVRPFGDHSTSGDLPACSS
jgi:pilus assembly protein CpaB